jgi:4-hydroxy-tetrahydrodipicolinate reductase
MAMIQVGVIGAGGRMGTEVCRAVAASDDCQLVAAVDPGVAGRSVADVAGIDSDVTVAANLDALADAGATVAVDFTHPDAVAGNVAWLLDHGIHAVVGTTGLTDAALDDLRARAEASDANAFLAPNFAIGAVLLMQFAAQAAVHLPHVEIIELHHDRKADAPSGTALRTAELIADARSETPPYVGGDDAHPGARGTRHRDVTVHAVRLPGLVAHQEVLFGGHGETLTIRHDSLDRTSFMPGVLLAVRHVADLDEPLVVGLEHLL